MTEIITGNPQVDLQNFMKSSGKNEAEAIKYLRLNFDDPQKSGPKSISDVSVGGIVSGKDNDTIASALGYSKDEMEAMFGKPGETDPKDIAAKLGLSDAEITNIFGEDALEETEKTDDASKDDAADDTTTAQDNKYKEVADALGYDELTVSAIMKYIENGNVNAAPEKVVPEVAKALGIQQNVVSDVLKYLNNGEI